MLRIGNGLRSGLMIALLAVALTPLTGTPAVMADASQGCTPGYWKNHVDNWQTVDPAGSVGETFRVPDQLASLAGVSLKDALAGGGGRGLLGAGRILYRAATAAYLNASHSAVDYPLDAATVLAQVDAAAASLNRDVMLGVAGDLDDANNLGCPLDNTPVPVPDDGGNTGGGDPGGGIGLG